MEEIFKLYGFKLTEKQIKNFNIYKELLIEWNRIINLTAITNEKEIIIKHFIDSYSISNKVFGDKKIKTVIDMGTGAGFPGIIAGILNPGIKFTLVDSVNKKITFLEEVVHKLELKNVYPKHHYLDKKNSSGKKFDIVISRAFMKPHKLIYFAKNYVNKNGFHVMLLTENQKNNFIDTINKYKPNILKYPYEGKSRYILKFK